MRSRQPLIAINRAAVVLLLCSVSLHHVCRAAITVKGSKDVEKKLAAIEASGAPCVSITGFCEAFGYAARRGMAAQKLTCLKGTARIVFSQDIPFYYVNDSLYQMPCGPILRKETLYLPVWLCALVFSRAENQTIEWNADDSVIFARPEAAEKTPGARSALKKTAIADGDEPDTTQQVIKTIVIDPGHGGKDPGAIGPDNTREKDIVLSIALKLRDMLKKKSA